MSEINDDDFLDFMMNTDLSDNFSEKELKYLFFKWKYFYRNLLIKRERENNKLESYIRHLENNESDHKNKIEELQIQLAEKENQLSFINNKKAEPLISVIKNKIKSIIKNKSK